MKEKELISAADASVSISSGVACDLGDLREYSVHVIFTGSDVVGTLALQASNDNANFVEVTGSSQAISASGDFLYNITNANYRYVRVSWAYTSGTGTITAKVVIKENPIKGA